MSAEFIGSYVLQKASREDIAEGRIWLKVQDGALRQRLEAHRPIVRITHGVGAARRSVHCEALYVDANDLVAFRERSSSLPVVGEGDLAFISAWYRDRLGVEVPTDTQVSLTVTFGESARPLSWQIYACMEHRQVVVRLSTWLGLIGLGLGVLGLGAALVPLADVAWWPEFLRSTTRVVGGGLAMAGIIELLWSTVLVVSSRIKIRTEDWLI